MHARFARLRQQGKLLLQWQLALGNLRLAIWDLLLTIGAVSLLPWLSLTIWRSAPSDVGEYVTYATRFWFGTPPFHLLPLEYPPLALAPFSLSLWPAFIDPLTTFTTWMAILFVGGYLLIIWQVGRTAGLLYGLYLFIGAAPYLVGRFDLVPALLALAALLAINQKRFALGGILLAVGGLIKIYPLLLLPLLVANCWRDAQMIWPRRLALLLRTFIPTVAILMLGSIVPWFINPLAAFSALSYATARPIQIESTWSVFAWVGNWFGEHTTIAFVDGSHNWTGTLSTHLASLTTPLLICGCLAIALVHLTGRLEFDRAFLATLCIIVITNKVFSTQYLIWLLPIVAVVVGWDYLWIAICLLTTISTGIYPFNDPYTAFQQDVFLAIIFLRNSLLCMACVRLLWPFSMPTALRLTAVRDLITTADPKRLYEKQKQ